MYMIGQKMKAYFVDFFFIQNLLLFVTSVNAICPTQLLKF